MEEKINIEDLVLPTDPLDHDYQKVIEASSSNKIKEEDTLETVEEDDQNYVDNQELPEVDKMNVMSHSDLFWQISFGN